MRENTNISDSGISFLGLLGILFIGLKLMGHINWPWWLVTLPLWGGLAVLVLCLIVFIFINLLFRTDNK